MTHLLWRNVGNSVSPGVLLLTEFEGVISFCTRQTVKWLRMILPVYVCCVEAYKNNHPLLANEIILAKPLTHMKLRQWKSAAASWFSWSRLGEMTPCWWERVSFCWCAQWGGGGGKRLTLSSLARAPPQQYQMLYPSTWDVPLRPSHAVLPAMPAGWNTRCVRTADLASCYDLGQQAYVVEGMATG